MDTAFQTIDLEDKSRNSEILLEAAKLFAAKGYDGTSIRDIARAVGVAQASLYHFFADKREIHSTVVSVSVERLLCLIREKLETCATAADRVEGLRGRTPSTFQKSTVLFRRGARLRRTHRSGGKGPGTADARYL